MGCLRQKRVALFHPFHNLVLQRPCQRSEVVVWREANLFYVFWWYDKGEKCPLVVLWVNLISLYWSKLRAGVAGYGSVRHFCCPNNTFLCLFPQRKPGPHLMRGVSTHILTFVQSPCSLGFTVINCVAISTEQKLTQNTGQQSSFLNVPSKNPEALLFNSIKQLPGFLLYPWTATKNSDSPSFYTSSIKGVSPDSGLKSETQPSHV